LLPLVLTITWLYAYYLVILIAYSNTPWLYLLYQTAMKGHIQKFISQTFLLLQHTKLNLTINVHFFYVILGYVPLVFESCFTQLTVSGCSLLLLKARHLTVRVAYMVILRLSIIFTSFLSFECEWMQFCTYMPCWTMQMNKGNCNCISSLIIPWFRLQNFKMLEIQISVNDVL